MSTKTAKRKLKIFPGRGLTGRDIKNRIRNRTLQGQVFDEDSYQLDESMDKFNKASKVEQIRLAKENSKEIAEIQRKLDAANKRNEQKAHEAEIERKVQEKLKEMAKEELKNNPQK